MSPFSSSSASSIPQLFERLQDLLSAREIVQFSDDEDVQMDSVQKKKSKFYLYENVLNIKAETENKLLMNKHANRYSYKVKTESEILKSQEKNSSKEEDKDITSKDLSKLSLNELLDITTLNLAHENRSSISHHYQHQNIIEQGNMRNNHNIYDFTINQRVTFLQLIEKLKIAHKNSCRQLYNSLPCELNTQISQNESVYLKKRIEEDSQIFCDNVMTFFCFLSNFAIEPKNKKSMERNEKYFNINTNDCNTIYDKTYSNMAVQFPRNSNRKALASTSLLIDTQHEENLSPSYTNAKDNSELSSDFPGDFYPLYSPSIFNIDDTKVLGFMPLRKLSAEGKKITSLRSFESKYFYNYQGANNSTPRKGNSNYLQNQGKFKENMDLQDQEENDFLFGAIHQKGKRQLGRKYLTLLREGKYFQKGTNNAELKLTLPCLNGSQQIKNLLPYSEFKEAGKGKNESYSLEEENNNSRTYVHNEGTDKFNKRSIQRYQGIEQSNWSVKNTMTLNEGGETKNISPSRNTEQCKDPLDEKKKNNWDSIKQIQEHFDEHCIPREHESTFSIAMTNCQYISTDLIFDISPQNCPTSPKRRYQSINICDVKWLLNELCAIFSHRYRNLHLSLETTSNLFDFDRERVRYLLSTDKKIQNISPSLAKQFCNKYASLATLFERIKQFANFSMDDKVHNTQILSMDKGKNQQQNCSNEIFKAFQDSLQHEILLLDTLLNQCIKANTIFCLTSSDEKASTDFLNGGKTTQPPLQTLLQFDSRFKPWMRSIEYLAYICQIHEGTYQKTDGSFSWSASKLVRKFRKGVSLIAYLMAITPQNFNTSAIDFEYSKGKEKMSHEYQIKLTNRLVFNVLQPYLSVVKSVLISGMYVQDVISLTLKEEKNKSNPSIYGNAWELLNEMDLTCTLPLQQLSLLENSSFKFNKTKNKNLQKKRKRDHVGLNTSHILFKTKAGASARSYENLERFIKDLVDRLIFPLLPTAKRESASTSFNFSILLFLLEPATPSLYKKAAFLDNSKKKEENFKANVSLLSTSDSNSKVEASIIESCFFENEVLRKEQIKLLSTLEAIRQNEQLNRKSFLERSKASIIQNEKEMIKKLDEIQKLQIHEQKEQLKDFWNSVKREQELIKETEALIAKEESKILERKRLEEEEKRKEEEEKIALILKTKYRRLELETEKRMKRIEWQLARQKTIQQKRAALKELRNTEALGWNREKCGISLNAIYLDSKSSTSILEEEVDQAKYEISSTFNKVEETDTKSLVEIAFIEAIVEDKINEEAIDLNKTNGRLSQEQKVIENNSPSNVDSKSQVSGNDGDKRSRFSDKVEDKEKNHMGALNEWKTNQMESLKDAELKSKGMKVDVEDEVRDQTYGKDNFNQRETYLSLETEGLAEKDHKISRNYGAIEFDEINDKDEVFRTNQNENDNDNANVVSWKSDIANLHATMAKCTDPSRLEETWVTEILRMDSSNENVVLSKIRESEESDSSAYKTVSEENIQRFHKEVNLPHYMESMMNQMEKQVLTLERSIVELLREDMKSVSIIPSAILSHCGKMKGFSNSAQLRLQNILEQALLVSKTDTNIHCQGKYQLGANELRVGLDKKEADPRLVRLVHDDNRKEMEHNIFGDQNLKVDTGRSISSILAENSDRLQLELQYDLLQSLYPELSGKVNSKDNDSIIASALNSEAFIVIPPIFLTYQLPLPLQKLLYLSPIDSGNSILSHSVGLVQYAAIQRIIISHAWVSNMLRNTRLNLQGLTGRSHFSKRSKHNQMNKEDTQPPFSVSFNTDHHNTEELCLHDLLLPLHGCLHRIGTALGIFGDHYSCELADNSASWGQFFHRISCTAPLSIKQIHQYHISYLKAVAIRCLVPLSFEKRNDRSCGEHPYSGGSSLAEEEKMQDRWYSEVLYNHHKWYLKAATLLAHVEKFIEFLASSTSTALIFDANANLWSPDETIENKKNKSHPISSLGSSFEFRAKLHQQLSHLRALDDDLCFCWGKMGKGLQDIIKQGSTGVAFLLNNLRRDTNFQHNAKKINPSSERKEDDLEQERKVLDLGALEELSYRLLFLYNQNHGPKK